MGLFGFGKKKEQQAVQQEAAPQVEQVQGVCEMEEHVGRIPYATSLSSIVYLQDVLSRIQGNTTLVQIVDTNKAKVPAGWSSIGDDYAVVLPDMTLVGTMSRVSLYETMHRRDDRVMAIIQRPADKGDYIRVWIPYTQKAIARARLMERMEENTFTRNISDPEWSDAYRVGEEVVLDDVRFEVQPVKEGSKAKPAIKIFNGDMELCEIGARSGGYKLVASNLGGEIEFATMKKLMSMYEDSSVYFKLEIMFPL